MAAALSSEKASDHSGNKKETSWERERGRSKIAVPVEASVRLTRSKQAASCACRRLARDYYCCTIVRKCTNSPEAAMYTQKFYTGTPPSPPPPPAASPFARDGVYDLA